MIKSNVTLGLTRSAVANDRGRNKAIGAARKPTRGKVKFGSNGDRDFEGDAMGFANT